MPLQLHSDVDKGDGRVKYVLSGEGAASIFIIDENTGDIHATKRLDREEQAYYTLRAQARDRSTNLPVEPESQFVIKVQDINDNEPKFLDGPYSARVAEMSPTGESVSGVPKCRLTPKIPMNLGSPSQIKGAFRMHSPDVCMSFDVLSNIF